MWKNTSVPLLSTANRPKHLLVYINPYGGKQQAKRIYEQEVAPLFARASISTHIIGEFHLLAVCALNIYDHEKIQHFVLGKW